MRSATRLPVRGRLALVVGAILVAACRNPGGAPAPTATEGVMRSPDAGPTGTFTLTSPEFTEGRAIPARYTCDGEDVSPPLEWEGAPEGTVSLAILVDDPDARNFVHWVAYNIDASATGGLPTGWSGEAEFQGRNDFGRIGYGGPCPPSGTHRYLFRLLALDTMLDLSGAPTAEQLMSAAAGHIVAEARLTAPYTRQR